MKDIYVFSGLGADRRVFRNVDLAPHRMIFIDWIPPLRGENLEAYAKRLVAGIKTERPVLIGLSFGGLMAIEVAKQLNTEKVILISSARTEKEIPYYYRLAGKLLLHKLIPTRLLKKANFITNWFFGVNSPADKQLLKTILHDTDKGFLKWAIHNIVTWDNADVPANTIHIHGTADRILPFRNVHADFRIDHGGHFMIFNRSGEINEIIKNVL